ncbi:MAG: hypothetical protein FVQ77_16790 [Cytophagales bacterium]|nr:hypothetical protein [Cytophagales bacterium]
MSKLLSKPALKAINRIGDIMMPKNGELPSYSELGGIEHIDEILQCAPENDIKDLSMILSILSVMPGFVLKWLIKKMGRSHKQKGGLSVIFRQLDFGLKGIILSTYYSEKAGSGYKGKTPLEVIGYRINRIPC